MLDVIILAGGTGRRLGALTRSKQKGALKFKDVPIITHVIQSILPLRTLKTIWIATGYRGKDIQETLEVHHADLLSSGKIRTLDAPHIRGELSRFAYALGHLPKSRNCIITGVDTILPAIVFQKLERRSRKLDQVTILMAVSAHTYIAPTHRLMTLARDVVKTYEHPDSVPRSERETRFTDVGTRFFHAKVLRELRGSVIPNDTDPDDFLRREVQKERDRVRAVVFKERWRHFASGTDFLK